MALYQVSAGSKILAADLNQLVQTLTGVAANALLLDGDTGSSYWLTIWQRNTANGLIAQFKNTSGIILDLTKNGVRMSIDGANFGKIPLIQDGAQPVSNKTLDATNTYTNIPGSQLLPASVGTTQITDAAITAAKLGLDAVGGNNMGIAEACFLYRSTDVSITQDSTTTISWDSEEFDSPNNMHDGADPSKIICRRTGLFLVGGATGWDTAMSDDWKTELAKNGSVVRRVAAGQVSTANNTYNPVYAHAVTLIRMNTNDYLQIKVTQSDGGARNFNGGTDRSNFWALRVGS